MVATAHREVLRIAKADPNCAVTGYNVAFDGQHHTATGSCTGVREGEVLAGSLNLGGTQQTAEGDYPADPWKFTRDDTGTTTMRAGWSTTTSLACSSIRPRRR